MCPAIELELHSEAMRKGQKTIFLEIIKVIVQFAVHIN